MMLSGVAFILSVMLMLLGVPAAVNGRRMLRVAGRMEHSEACYQCGHPQPPDLCLHRYPECGANLLDPALRDRKNVRRHLQRGDLVMALGVMLMTLALGCAIGSLFMAWK